MAETTKKCTIKDVRAKFTKIDMTSKVKQRKQKDGKLGPKYLPWAPMWNEVLNNFPEATWEPLPSNDGHLYWHDGRTAYVVVRVDIEGIVRDFRLPVMNHMNQAVPVATLNYCDVNKAIMRCLVKNLAVNYGLGINVYCDEDFVAGGEDDYFTEAAENPTGATEVPPTVETTPATAAPVGINPAVANMDEKLAIDVLRTPFPFEFKDWKGKPTHQALMECIAFEKQDPKPKAKLCDALYHSFKGCIEGGYNIKVNCATPLVLRDYASAFKHLVNNPELFVKAYENI